MNDGSFSSTFQLLSVSLLPFFLPTAIHINVYFYRHQAEINFALFTMAWRVQTYERLCVISWCEGIQKMINDMSARNWVGTGEEKERNSNCHKNENCFTRQLTLHSIFRCRDSSLISLTLIPVSNLSKKIINKIFKTFQKALRETKIK